MTEPTPIAVPPELEALMEAVPGLIAGLRDARVAGEKAAPLDEREIELVRIATLVGIAAPEASFRSHVARALEAGADAADVWGAVASVATIVGVPRLLHAAPFIQAAIEESLAS